MKKSLLWLVTGLFLTHAALAGVLPSMPTNGYPVIDITAVGKMGEQLSTMNNQYNEMVRQYAKMQEQYIAMQSEIARIRQGDFTQSEITRELNKVDGLIKQASSLEADLYEARTSQFSTNYRGYGTTSNLNGGSFNDFYKRNVNTTLSTLDSATEAIETDKQNNSGIAVDSTISQVRANILNAEGTTQAVSSLAEVNIEILKQLQSMHMQLAAIAEAENAASAKKIQEEAVAAAEARKRLEDNAVPIPVSYGQYPLKSPTF